MSNQMTQGELAQYLGVTPRSVAGWESGKQHIPGPICRLLALADGKEQGASICIPFLKEKGSKHYLHNRRFSVSAIHGKATWIDEDGTLFVKFRYNGEEICLPMEQRFREHGDESSLWNVFGRWRIDEYLQEAALDAKAGEISGGIRIHTDARG